MQHRITIFIKKYAYMFLFVISAIYTLFIIIDSIHFFIWGRFCFFLYNNAIDPEKLNGIATAKELTALLSSNVTWYSDILLDLQTPLWLANALIGFKQVFFGEMKCKYIFNLVFAIIMTLFVLYFK